MIVFVVVSADGELWNVRLLCGNAFVRLTISRISFKRPSAIVAVVVIAVAFGYN